MGGGGGWGEGGGERCGVVELGGGGGCRGTGRGWGVVEEGSGAGGRRREATCVSVYALCFGPAAAHMPKSYG